MDIKGLRYPDTVSRRGQCPFTLNKSQELIHGPLTYGSDLRLGNVAAPYSPLPMTSTLLIVIEDVNYGLHILLLAEDDGGFLLVKDKRGMSESTLAHYQCFIGGQNWSWDPGFLTGMPSTCASSLLGKRKGIFCARVINRSSVYSFRV